MYKIRNDRFHMVPAAQFSGGLTKDRPLIRPVPAPMTSWQLFIRALDAAIFG